MENLRKYGFCKAHVLSYAQLVWQSYLKAHRPKKFWRSTLKNIDTFINLGFIIMRQNVRYFEYLIKEKNQFMQNIEIRE